MRNSDIAFGGLEPIGAAFGKLSIKENVADVVLRKNLRGGDAAQFDGRHPRNMSSNQPPANVSHGNLTAHRF